MSDLDLSGLATTPEAGDFAGMQSRKNVSKFLRSLGHFAHASSIQIIDTGVLVVQIRWFPVVKTDN